MNFKKNIVGTLLLMSFAATGVAQEGQYLVKTNISGEPSVPKWETINFINTQWIATGVNYGCDTWTPSTAEINWGETFSQSRNCQQDQERNATPVLFNNILNATKPGETFSQSQTITIIEHQPAIGQRDYIADERVENWSSWTDVGGHHSCTLWTPQTETVNLYDDFSQTRDCQQAQTRSRNVFHVWASGKETAKRVDTEEQTITEQEQRVVQGTKDYVYGERVASWSNWSNTGTPHSCTAWTPAPDTINLDQSYTQKRNCQQDQDADRNIYNVWRSGKETLNRVESRTQTITVEKNRGAVGEKDFIVTQRIGEWTSWSNNGSPHTCTTWTPSPSTINLDQSFTQTRNCQQNQVSERNIYDVWQSGKETLNRVEPQAQTITIEKNRSAVGEKDFITSERIGSWTAWIDEGGHFDCSSWSPSVGTVNYGDNFTQTRDCSQKQIRERNIYDVWQSGKETLKRTEDQLRNLIEQEQKTATGTKDYIVGERQGNWSSWSNTGSLYSCSSWSPDRDTIDNGVYFTQTRSCNQNQRSTRSIYKIWKSGKEEFSRNEQRTRTITINDSRQTTGTKETDVVIRTERDEYAIPIGSYYGCSPWAETSPGIEGRICLQDYEVSVYTIYVYSSGKRIPEFLYSYTYTQRQSMGRPM